VRVAGRACARLEKTMASSPTVPVGAVAAIVLVLGCNSRISVPGAGGAASSRVAGSGGGAVVGTGGAGGALLMGTGGSAPGGTGGAPALDGGCGLGDGASVSSGSFPACGGQPLCDAKASVLFMSSTTCPLPVVACPGAPPGGGAASTSFTPLDVAAAQCFLQKLRDRAVGNVTFDWGTSNGFCAAATTYYSFGDGTVAVAVAAYFGQAGGCDVTVRRALQPVAWFDTCLAAADMATLVDCMVNVTLCQGNTGAVCQP
jgi:hypothetical protein